MYRKEYEGDITSPPICGYNATLLCGLPQNEIRCNTSAVEIYPDINLNNDTLNISGSGTCISNKYNDSWHNIMIPVNEGPLKRMIRTYFESGVKDALNEACRNDMSTCWPVIFSIAKLTCGAIQFIESIKTKLIPHKKVKCQNDLAEYAQTRDWLTSIVRCIAWHPNCFKIAVAGIDDSVRIYTTENSILPVLRSGNQKWITCMAWRPYSAVDFVVGCEKGICLWSLDNNMHMARPFSQTVCLTHPNHCPVSALEWHKNGTLLASSSISDTDILIWNIDKMQKTALKRVGYACSLLKWSLNGSYLFSSTVGKVFRIWNAENKWETERWSVAKGHIQSACWSPCCSFILFVTSHDSTLYRVQPFSRNLAFRTDMPIADFSKTIVNGRELGGMPQQIIWDSKGLCLAITFKDTPCVAVYSTSIYNDNLSISPTGYIVNPCDEYPAFICFQSINRKNDKIVITIGWSGGCIQYVPIMSCM